MKTSTKALIIAVIIIGILGNIAMPYLSMNGFKQQNYVGAIVPLLCCIYSCYYLIQLCLIYANVKQTEKHCKIAKENNMGAFGYIARDSTGYLYFYEAEPTKNEELGVWQKTSGKVAPLPYQLYQDVRWEDSKPTNVLLPAMYFE